jgi:prevent-host-death family protein
MLINATKFKENVGKYLALAGNEDLIITKNGKPVAKLVGIHKNNALLTDSLIGIIPDSTVNPKQLREERLTRHESTN